MPDHKLTYKEAMETCQPASCSVDHVETSAQQDHHGSLSRRLADGGFLEHVSAASARQTDRQEGPHGLSGHGHCHERGRVAKANVQLFRHWAEHSEWVRAAINMRKTQVSAAQWDIVPFDPEKTSSESLKQQVKDLFDRPNPATDSFRSFVEPIIEDILVLDAGVIEKVRNLRGEWSQTVAASMAARSGSAPPGIGSIPTEARYFWYPDGVPARAVHQRRHDSTSWRTRATYRPVGLSKFETLKLTIDVRAAGPQLQPAAR